MPNSHRSISIEEKCSLCRNRKGLVISNLQHNVPNQGMPVQQNFTPQNDGQHYNAPSPASHPQGQYDHPQQNQQQPTATNIATATNQHNKRKPNEMSQDGSVATEHDSKQPATSLDVSMDHGNSSSAADESMTNTSVFSHESRS